MTLLQDVRYALRMLAKKRGFTAVAVITLALGIGANSAIFSVVNGLLLRPLPYTDSDRLAIIWTHSPGANVAQDWPSPGQFAAVKSQTDVFEDLALVRGRSFNLSGGETPERVDAVQITPNLLTMLGARPLAGRLLLPEEDRPGSENVVVISHSLWQRRFGSDPSVVGRAVTLNGESVTVVGVLPRDFSLGYEVMPTVSAMQQPELFLPLALDAKGLESQGDENYNVVARLKPDATVERAQTELDVVAGRLAQQFPDYYPPSRAFRLSVRPLLEQVVGDVRPALLVLLGAVGFVLLIACANVANLLLARAATREKEMAIRTAVGASRRRVVRQLLTESVVLACLGGALGLLAAYWGLDALRGLGPGNIPRLQDVGMDLRVLSFTFGVAVVDGRPLRARARAPRLARQPERDFEGGRAQFASAAAGVCARRSWSSEIALSLVLLVGAGLLVRSFMRVQQVEPGFDARNVLSMRLSVAGTSYKGERSGEFFRELSMRVRRLPGVESAGTASILPLGGGIGWGSINHRGPHRRRTGRSRYRQTSASRARATSRR